MEYGQLKCFLLEKMRMSHIYQPVMIKHLLRNNGVASDTDIAKEISLQDPTQIEYYQNITNQMVGKILKNHKIVDKKKRDYALNGFEELTKDQIIELINICNSKLEQYIDKRGQAVCRQTKVDFLLRSVSN